MSISSCVDTNANPERRLPSVSVNGETEAPFVSGGRGAVPATINRVTWTYLLLDAATSAAEFVRWRKRAQRLACSPGLRPFAFACKGGLT